MAEPVALPKLVREIPVYCALKEYERADGTRTWIAVYQAKVGDEYIEVPIAKEVYGGSETPEKALEWAQPSIFGL